MARIAREVAIGDRFVAEHDGKDFVLEIVKHNDKPAFKVVKPKGWDCAEDQAGRIDKGLFRSISAASGAVAQSNSTNGWQFWRPEGTEKPEPKPRGRSPKAEATEATEEQPEAEAAEEAAEELDL